MYALKERKKARKNERKKERERKGVSVKYYRIKKSKVKSYRESSLFERN
jgi:hypothetical protein